MREQSLCLQKAGFPSTIRPDLGSQHGLHPGCLLYPSFQLRSLPQEDLSLMHALLTAHSQKGKKRKGLGLCGRVLLSIHQLEHRHLPLQESSER